MFYNTALDILYNVSIARLQHCDVINSIFSIFNLVLHGKKSISYFLLIISPKIGWFLEFKPNSFTNISCQFEVDRVKGSLPNIKICRSYFNKIWAFLGSMAF